MIGVIGTGMQDTEQQRIMEGIIAQAQQEHADVAVLSNLFNPYEPERAGCCENRIFELIRSADPDALIVLSESFVNETLRSNICALLREKTDIPVLPVGAAMPGLELPCISTSDANDMEEITRHLIEAHGFRDIALLTGPFSVDVSCIRREGYRRALEQHGIPFDPAKVYEGDFWYYSGEKLAGAFLSGEKPMPEAVVCANDYMAFGLLDAFENAGVNILDKMAVTGYEFIQERNLHTPLLTTYQRNRSALGKTAVQILMQKLRGETPAPFTPPQGRLIRGVTCGCPVSEIRQHEELHTARTAMQYADWYLKSEMERMLTECRDMDAFAAVMGNFMYLLKNVRDILLCLYEDWHRPAPASDILLCRSVNPWTDHTVFRLKKGQLFGLTARCDHPAAYYWLPLCFGDRLFGYCVLRYDAPNSYDNVCRSWIKAVANGLEFLRLKADVRYLLQCRVLSGAYDSITGMFSREGLKNACRLMQNTNGADGITALLLRCEAGQHLLYTADDAKETVKRLLAAAEIIRQFRGGICGRISEYDFLLLIPAERIGAQPLEYAVTAELLRIMPVGSFLCTAVQLPGGIQPDSLFQTLTDRADRLEAQNAECRLLPHSAALSELRRGIYQSPAAAWSIAQNAAQLGFHPDYFNRKYKECFGLSFHQDCIRSRVLYAAYLLMHSTLTVSGTAERCGYTESKYFIRQFAAVTGSPPKAFRSLTAEITGTDSGSGIPEAQTEAL